MNTCPDCQNDLVCHDQGECLRPTPETDVRPMNERPTPEQLERDLSDARDLCRVLRDRIVKEGVLHKVKHERWMRLCFDMLSVYKEGQDFIITPERVECWREEWNELTGMNFNDYLP